MWHALEIRKVWETVVVVITARVARIYRFCLVCVCLCLSGYQKLIISSLQHIFYSPGGGGLDPFRHVRLPVCPYGPGCLSGVFCPFNWLHSTTNHFQTLPGHAGHHVGQFLSLPCPAVRVGGRTDTFGTVSVQGFLSPHLPMNVCMYREGAGLYQPHRHRPPTGPYAVPKRYSVVAEFYIEML